MPLHDLSRFGFQDWIGIIAHKLAGARPIRAAQPVPHRPRPRNRRLNARKVRMNPCSREIRNRYSTLRTIACRPNSRPRRLPQGGCHRGCRQCYQWSRAPLQSCGGLPAFFPVRTPIAGPDAFSSASASIAKLCSCTRLGSGMPRGSASARRPRARRPGGGEPGRLVYNRPNVTARQ
jgi:hypothetical protein